MRDDRDAYIAELEAESVSVDKRLTRVREVCRDQSARVLGSAAKYVPVEDIMKALEPDDDYEVYGEESA